MRRRRAVINPDGKGPRVWCGRCGAWTWAEQQPWPKSGYAAKKHAHIMVKEGEGK